MNEIGLIRVQTEVSSFLEYDSSGKLVAMIGVYVDDLIDISSGNTTVLEEISRRFVTSGIRVWGSDKFTFLGLSFELGENGLSFRQEEIKKPASSSW